MSNGLILSIDQGTTNTKALAFDPAGHVVASASVAMNVSYPRPGWAEQSADEIVASVRTLIATIAARTGADMEALAISNQRETIVVWDADSGRPIAPAIIWQCRRSAERCAAVKAAGHAPLVEARTGLGIDPLFPAAKIGLLLDSVDGARDAARAGRLRAGTIDCWLLWNLGGRLHATDHSNASRTQLFNTRTLAWDEELARIFDVPLGMMPEVRSSDSRFAELEPGSTALAAGVPIHAMIGDSHAALFGHGVRTPGIAKATYGTGSSLMTLTGERVASRHGLSSTIAWSSRAGGVAHALEGNISVSGQAAAFMSDLLGVDGVDALTELAAGVEDTNGTSFVPALVGLGAPYWEPDARGLIAGLSLGTKPAHLARAAIEAIALQVADVFAAMESDLGAPLGQLAVDGGPTRNDVLMQLQADIVGRPVRRGALAEASAAGAAAMAAQGLGRAGWSTPAPARTFVPARHEEWRRQISARWHEAVDRARWAPGKAVQ